MKPLGIVGFSTSLVFCAGLAFGQDAANDLKRSTVTTAHAVKHVGKKIGKATKTGGEDVGHATKVAAEDTAHGAKTAAVKTGEEVKGGTSK